MSEFNDHDPLEASTDLTWNGDPKTDEVQKPEPSPAELERAREAMRSGTKSALFEI